MRRQTQLGVIESIDHLLTVVSEWMSGDRCTHVSVCVCVCLTDMLHCADWRNA